MDNSRRHFAPEAIRRPFATCFFLYLIVVTVNANGVLGPVTESVVNFEVNGNPSQLHRAEYIYTENTRTATAFVGNYEVTSRVDGKPGYQYVATEVAAIPSFMTTYIQESCLVKNARAFVNSRVLNDPDIVAGTPIAHATQTLSHPRHGVVSLSKNYGKLETTAAHVSESGRVGTVNRRLLIWFIAAGVAALAVGTAALESALRAHERITALTQVVEDQTHTIDKLKDRTDRFSADLARTNEILGDVTSGLNTTKRGLADVNLSVNRTGEALKALTQETQDNLNAEKNRTNAAVNLLQNNIAGLDEAFRTQLLKVYDRIGNVTGLLTSNVNKAYTYSQKLAQRILNLNNDVWELINRRQLRAMTTAGIFNFVDTLDPSIMFPLFTDPGVAPDPNALVGENARLLLETISYNGVTIPTQGTRRVMRIDFHIYIETGFGVDNARPTTTYENLVQLYGPSGCKRPYFETPDAFDNAAGAPVCGVWVEEVRTTCDARTTGTQFEWKTANTSLTSDKQSPNILNSYCSSQVIVDPIVVYRSAAAFNTRLSSLCKEQLASNYWMVTTNNLNSIGYIEGARLKSDCDIPLDGTLPKTSTNDEYTTPIFFTHMLLEIGTASQLTTIFNAQMRLEGRIPGGLDFYELPFTYTPTRRETVNGVDRVIYDGGAEATQCYYATMAAASVTAIPVYSLVPWTDNLVTANVVVETVQRINPTLPDYDINVASYPANVQFDPEANFILPDSLIYIGELPKLGTGRPTTLYDVPDELLTIAGGYTARKNKLTCYIMPPGTRTTQDLPTWTLANPRVYKASECGLSAATFGYKRVSDSEGYPLCDVSGGIPDAKLLGTTPIPMDCDGGFVWNDGYTITASTPPTYACDAAADPGVLIATNGTISSSPTMDFTQNWALSLVYWTRITNGVTRLFSYNTASTLLVIDGGDNIVIRGAGSQTFSVPVYHANSDADVHVVFINWDKLSTTLTVYVDGIQLAKTTSWTASSNGGTTPNGGYVPNMQVLGTLTPGNMANVQALKYYSAANVVTATGANILNWSHCLYSFYAALQRCVPKKDIFANSNTPKATNSPLIVAYQQPAANCVPVTSSHPQSILLTDKTAADFTTFAQAAQFTLTFFLDHTGPGLTDATIVDFTAAGGYKFLISNAGGNYFVGLSSYSSPTSATVASTPSLAGDVSHFIALVVNGPQVSVFVDTIPVHTFTNVNFGTGVFLSSIVMHKQATMARYYSYQIVGVQAMTQALQCDLPPGPNPVLNDYRTPLATCVPDPILNTKGYCRHPSMCNGHCSAWSTDINSVAKTFTVTRYKCNLGWKGTNCDIQCPRVNFRGECLPDLDVTSTFNHTQTGLIPGASNCARYKLFQTDSHVSGSGLTIFSFYPRQYQLRVLLQLPSGTITTKAVGGKCPEVVMGSPDDGTTLQIQMKNPGADTLTLQVDVTNNPDVGGPEIACMRQETITIDPRFTSVYSVPACGNMSITIKTLTGTGSNGQFVFGTTCSSLTGQSIQQAVATLLDVTPQTAGAITVASDRTLTAVNNNALDIIGVLVGIMRIQAQFSGATQQELILLDAYKKIAADASLTANLRNVNFTEMFSGQVILGGTGTKLDNLINQVQTATTTFESRFNISTDLANIKTKVDANAASAIEDAKLRRDLELSINKTKADLEALKKIPIPDATVNNILKKAAQALNLFNPFGPGNDNGNAECGFFCKLGNKFMEFLFIGGIIVVVCGILYYFLVYKKAQAQFVGGGGRRSAEYEQETLIRSVANKAGGRRSATHKGHY